MEDTFHYLASQASFSVLLLECKCKMRWSLTYVATPIAVAVREALFISSGLTNSISRSVQILLQCTAVLC